MARKEIHSTKGLPLGVGNADFSGFVHLGNTHFSMGYDPEDHHHIMVKRIDPHFKNHYSYEQVYKKGGIRFVRRTEFPQDVSISYHHDNNKGRDTAAQFIRKFARHSDKVHLDGYNNKTGELVKFSGSRYQALAHLGLDNKYKFESILESLLSGEVSIEEALRHTLL